jgi:serine/threonine protein kinase
MIEIGACLGPYKILARLGAGGMGEVYRGKDTRLGREVAVKVLPEFLADNNEALMRFEREARALAALSHPNILTIFDFGKEQDICYAVTELLEGETLRAAIARGPIAWNRVIEIAIAITEGLHAAHSRGIVHRDLKPENIFLTSEGVVKILDFGLVRLEKSSSSQSNSSSLTMPALETEPGVMMGTYPYMSPEQVRGETVDTRSDLFSFGSIMHEMLSGKILFMRRTAGETIAAVLIDSPSELTTLVGDLPPELDSVIQRCLKRDREERFQTSRDLAAALKAISKRYRSPEDISEPVPLKNTDMVDRILRFAERGPRDFGLRLWVEAEGTGRTVRDFMPDEETPERFYIGDKVVFCASADRDCYLWIVDVGTTGRNSIIYPSKMVNENRVTAGQVIRIPGTFSGKTGVETFHAFASSDPIDLKSDESTIDSSSRSHLATATIKLSIDERARG